MSLKASNTCIREVKELEPFQQGDAVIVSIVLFILLVNGVSLFYILWNRNYKPIAAKQVNILAVQYLGKILLNCLIT